MENSDFSLAEISSGVLAWCVAGGVFTGTCRAWLPAIQLLLLANEIHVFRCPAVSAIPATQSCF